MGPGAGSGMRRRGKLGTCAQPSDRAFFPIPGYYLLTNAYSPSFNKLTVDYRTHLILVFIGVVCGPLKYIVDTPTPPTPQIESDFVSVSCRNCISCMGPYKTGDSRDQNLTHKLQKRVYMKFSILQLFCFMLELLYTRYTVYRVRFTMYHRMCMSCPWYPAR